MTHINTFVHLKPLVRGRWYGHRWVVWRVNKLTPHLSPSWCTRILTRQLADRLITKKVRKEKRLLKPGFHIVVSVVSVVRKKFIGQIQLYGNLPYKCSIQKKRQIQLVVRDRMNSICPMNFFRTTDTTETTDTTIWKPDLRDNEVSDYSKTGEIKTLACFN